MPLARIQAIVDALAKQQISNEWGSQRYALLFEPGTYGTSAAPLNFQLGYYTAVAGLGRLPGDVVINGSIDVFNQCDDNDCVALTNFWRSISNLTINVTTPGGRHAGEIWAVSQAAPLRRVRVSGAISLTDNRTGPALASGGFIADSQFTGGAVFNGTQQQWLMRNSAIEGWSNGVWNQVFSGVIGAPAQCFPRQPQCGGPYTTLPASPVTREAPYLFSDPDGATGVFVPAVQRDTRGATWRASEGTPGKSLPLESFFIASPADTAGRINAALATGKNLILTPGVYKLESSIAIARPDTIVLGLGFPSLVPQYGDAAMQVDAEYGVIASDIIFDAGPENSPVLLKVGKQRGKGERNASAADPSSLYDLSFRIGGAAPGSASVSLIVNSDNVLLDDIWAWRADHGEGLGWDRNKADTGVIVNGDNVTAYGLFVEHYQKYEVIWNGEGGAEIFFQNEMPYDAPNQAAWMEAPGVAGWAAFKIADGVKRFSGYGMGSYGNFNRGVNLFAANAFEAPASLPAASLRDLFTVFLNSSALGGILNVVNDLGGGASAANPGVAVSVVNHP